MIEGGIPYNIWDEMKNERGIFKEDYHEKVHEIRDGFGIELPDGRTATHLMVWGQIAKDVFVAFPTLFPDYENPLTGKTDPYKKFSAPEGEFPEDAYQYAKSQGELFIFDTAEEAKEWASPNAPWKNTGGLNNAE